MECSEREQVSQRVRRDDAVDKKGVDSGLEEKLDLR